MKNHNWVVPRLAVSTTALMLGLASVPAMGQAISTEARDEIVVTAQRTDENIQDVPIAVTAFSAENLEQKQIEGFSDLQFATPNMTFTKSNFTGVNITLRGVSSDTVAASGDAGVSFHINEAPLPTRVFETEYFDLQRVEVLRGPQGTLFGRNATGGVINVITARPTDQFEADIELEAGEYGHFKTKGMLNVPVTEDFSLRFAGISVERDGFTTNLNNGEDIDDRDVVSYRVTGQWDPTDNLTAWVMYSLFEEDDSKARIGRTMCAPSEIPSLGCLNDVISYGGGPGGGSTFGGLVGAIAGLHSFSPLDFTNSVATGEREVYAQMRPVYKADEEYWMGGITLDLPDDGLIVNALAATHNTSVFSQNSYGQSDGSNKFSTANPAFPQGIVPISGFTPDASGIFSGAVQGYYDVPFSYDTSTASTETEFYEARVSSVWEGQWNFLLGANILKAESNSIYDVYFNTADAAALAPVLSGVRLYPSHYRNETSPYELDSKAVFGEVYFEPNEELKLTGGLRWSKTKKSVMDRQLLFNSVILAGGTAVGDPVTAAVQTSNGMPGIPQPGDARAALGQPNSFEETEVTGRAGFDWMPETDFSDSTMVYGFYSRGYRPGAFNPPIDPALFPNTNATTDPEFVDAFELGTKNLLFDSQLTANASVFYYDYEGLQTSKIVNRTSVNENIDAEIWGVETDFLYTPAEIEGLSFDVNLSFLHTKIAGGTTSVNTHNPTNDDPTVWLLRDYTNGSNCVVDRAELAAGIGGGTVDLTSDTLGVPKTLSADGRTSSDPTGTVGIGAQIAAGALPTLGNCAALDGKLASGAADGVPADLSGNELSQSPEFTFHIGTQYVTDIKGTNLSVLGRVDFYWQADMYSRIFNTQKDLIEDWHVVNAQILIQSNEDPWYIRFWVQNLTDENNITGHYFTDPSSGQFRNDFLIDPRMFGVAVGAKL